MATPHLPVEGGCLCQTIRYHSSAPPVRGGYCHCSQCRRAYGGFFLASLQFAAAEFSFTKGNPRYFRSSNLARRGFCEACGSPIIFSYDGAPTVWILIGSLDHAEDWPLAADATWGASVHLHVDSKIRWVTIADGLPQLASDVTPFRDEARGGDSQAAD